MGRAKEFAVCCALWGCGMLSGAVWALEGVGICRELHSSYAVHLDGVWIIPDNGSLVHIACRWVAGSGGPAQGEPQVPIPAGRECSGVFTKAVNLPDFRLGDVLFTVRDPNPAEASCGDGGRVFRGMEHDPRAPRGSTIQNPRWLEIVVIGDILTYKLTGPVFQQFNMRRVTR